MTQVLCTAQQAAGIRFGEIQAVLGAVCVKDTGSSLLALSLSNQLRLQGAAAYIKPIDGHCMHCCGLYIRNKAGQSLTK